MKRLLLLLSLGIIGTLAVMKMTHRKESLHFVTEEERNFGAFPPEIPATQFDDMFV